jgi:hypothetical protein
MTTVPVSSRHKFYSWHEKNLFYFLNNFAFHKKVENFDTYSNFSFLKFYKKNSSRKGQMSLGKHC